VNVNELVLVQGMSDTKATLAEWNRRPWPVFRTWLFWSVMTAVGLLCAVYVVAKMSRPDPTPLVLPGVNRAAVFGDAQHVFYRNLLVLALHSMACVAGFMAGSTLPQQAAMRNGFSRWIHEKAGRFAIAFVIGATTFSLSTQAYILGHAASTVSAHLGISEAKLLLALSIHAIPELTALFLPLAAWTMASRKGRWEDLLAATFATTSVAIPILLIAAATEVWITPLVMRAVI
jgi:hypothetical protein